MSLISTWKIGSQIAKWTEQGKEAGQGGRRSRDCWWNMMEPSRKKEAVRRKAQMHDGGQVQHRTRRGKKGQLKSGRGASPDEPGGQNAKRVKKGLRLKKAWDWRKGASGVQLQAVDACEKGRQVSSQSLGKASAYGEGSQGMDPKMEGTIRTNPVCVSPDGDKAKKKQWRKTRVGYAGLRGITFKTVANTRRLRTLGFSKQGAASKGPYPRATTEGKCLANIDWGARWGELKHAMTRRGVTITLAP